jgi:inorganic pyrophosphatase
VSQVVKSARRQISSSAIRSKYVVKTEGTPDSLEFRAFIQDSEGNTVSPWHDIPLKAGDGLYNFICEIPKETSAKMEVATDESSTPIKQDTKKGKLRFYPYNINWNYGMLPQTWEDPSHANPEVNNTLGDNDPVDVVEISDRTAQIGEVYAVKPLAVLAMIDEGELDWKVVAIRADDPKADKVSDIEDVEREFPGTLEAIRVWFRDYKTPDGKLQNEFGFDDKPQNAAYAKKVIEETNQFWSKLVTRVTDKGELSLV